MPYKYSFFLNLIIFAQIIYSKLFYEDKARNELTMNQVQRAKALRPYAEKRNERTTNSEVTVIRTWLKFNIQNTHPTDTAKMVFFMGAHAK